MITIFRLTIHLPEAKQWFTDTLYFYERARAEFYASRMLADLRGEQPAMKRNNDTDSLFYFGENPPLGQEADASVMGVRLDDPEAVERMIRDVERTRNEQH